MLVLPEPGAMVTHVGHACAVFAGIGKHLVQCRPLVEMRENQGFFLRPVALNIYHVLFLDVDKVMENPQLGIRHMRNHFAGKVVVDVLQIVEVLVIS